MHHSWLGVLPGPAADLASPRKPLQFKATDTSSCLLLKHSFTHFTITYYFKWVLGNLAPQKNKSKQNGAIQGKTKGFGVRLTGV